MAEEPKSWGIAGQLSALLTIDAYIDDLGVQHDWLNTEEARLLDELKRSVEDETRQRADEAKRAEGGAEAARG